MRRSAKGKSELLGRRHRSMVGLVVALTLAGCSAKRDVLRSLKQLTGRADLIYTEAAASEAELLIAEPMVEGTPAHAPIVSARKRQGIIQLEASTAKDELGTTAQTVESKLKDIPTFAWWVRWLVFPIGGIALLVLAVSVLGSMGVPLFTGAAAWLARRGFGVGRKLADIIGRALPGHDEDEDTTPIVALDRIATAARASAFGNALWEQEQKARKVERALRPKPLSAPLVSDGR
jgi:hypothetical protein